MRDTAGPDETQAERIAAILANGAAWEDALEGFVSQAVVEAGHRSSWRWSDGIDGLKVMERSELHLRVIARIWEIEQVQTLFWLDLDARDGAPIWTLYFDIAPGRSERFRRNAVHLVASPDEVAWRAVIHSAG